MTTDRPPPGSAWARTCPDAYPYAWFEAQQLPKLPAGFSRFATPAEVEIITGATTTTAVRRNPATRPAVPAAPKPRPAPASGSRWQQLNGFVDGQMRDLTACELRVWLALFRDTKPTGTARTGQADIGRRAGISTRGVRKALSGLVAKGLVSVVTRGRIGTGPSTYRVSGVSQARAP
jgi:hypothetical protein